MKRIIYLFVLALIASSGFGQKVDFSGKWKINREKNTHRGKALFLAGGEMTIIEEYKMNGENLSIKTSASSSYGEMIEVYVFDRQ
jgi:hypothetical protein